MAVFTSHVTSVSARATLSEADLAAAAAEDLDGTFPEVVRRYGPVVYTVAVRLCGQRADAEDLAAASFERAYRALRTQPARQTAGLRFRPWLVTIALNQWRNQLRTRSRRPAIAPLEFGHDPPAAGADPAEHLPGDPAVACALAALPQPQRLAVLLRHVAGLSTSEVALALGCPPGTAKSHISRGLTALRTTLDPASAPTPDPECDR